ncbi:hypothetical protein SERLA73DRAFT_176033 [Serpula lacrymans var. lacrymans S7.3]|uniref:BZIP domain-containing protein n=2 Tax=Serpula lacrymans var. lacrymans TaxID=341189 RepID=F8PM49_SERL3|nr:uncharacterized protein SERLADRAFT_458760 [Serpula lacrymans var. lacrymans S7.9]EGO02681.1 hypothetical protein SERLA73DRAFT_176033 [Serpula lacrymans var. lacrymans S7.3]EGO28381.1 hypothetical protein SERLADRAFT_458760 [Serpula lacrymans var. lacrymans S7.9]
MPNNKSGPTQYSALDITSSLSKPDPEAAASRMSDIALRKKKNADAQAAFRQRRANYIATLEETVTSLESVVLQLQDSCREARSEAADLRQGNIRLRQDFRERESFWRALWQARKGGQVTEADDLDLPPLPSSFATLQHTNSAGQIAQTTISTVNQYRDEGTVYQSNDESSNGFCRDSYGAGSSQSYADHSPSLSYSGAERSQQGEGSSHHYSLYDRISKQNEYNYPVSNSTCEAAPWSHSIQNKSSSESPMLTTEMSYNSCYSDDPKLHLNTLDTAPYIFSSSRSLSPSTSTPPSSSTTSLTSTFQFSFPDGSITQDHHDFEFHGHTSAHSAEVTLHGGTADISVRGSGSDGVRYRVGARRANSGPERPLLPAIPYFSGSDNSSQHERGSSEGEGTYSHHLRSRPHRGTPQRESRSPSPGAPPISGTLAVIKAQAFGALRRTRVRSKKSSDGAAKVAMEVLEARGIGMGVGGGISSKRPRLLDDTEVLT